MTRILLCLSLMTLGLSQASAYQFVELSKEEACEISDNIAIEGAEYTKKDVSAVAKLCSYDIHLQEDHDGRKAMAACPKLNSTFPAVEFIKIPKGLTKSEVEKKCNKTVGGKNSGKRAKFKYSITCANKASIIGYYHVSRGLGIKAVPPAVIRTMDLQSHIKIAERAKGFVAGNNEIVSKSWRKLHTALVNKDSDLLTPDKKLTLGVLSENPRNEQKTYDGVYLGGDNQAARLSKFMSAGSSTYQKLKIKKPIEDIVGSDLTDSNFTKIQQMKDVADMIVLDTLFGQKDRFGNTHSVYTWMVVQADGSLKKLDGKDIEEMMEEDIKNGTLSESTLEALDKADSMKKDWRPEVKKRKAKIRAVVESYLGSKGLQFAFAEELMLKDNDCGLMNSNPFKKKKVIAGIAHISPETYDQLMKLYQKVIVEGSMDKYLGSYLLMTDNDIDQFKTGLKYAAETLKAKSDNGSLYKDLVVKAHFKPKPRPMTEDGLPIHVVSRSGVNVRTAKVLEVGTDDASLYRVDDVGQKTQEGDKVAIISRDHPVVGNNKFIEVRVVESDHLPVGATVFLWSKSIRW